MKNFPVWGGAHLRIILFMQSVSIGSWEVETDLLPASPPSHGAGGGAGGGDTPELILEYWSTKGPKEKVCHGR